MKKYLKPYSFKIGALFILIVSLFLTSWQEQKSEDNGWGVYRGDEKGTSYSPFDQINVANVAKLQNVWTFQIKDVQEGDATSSSQSNPIIVDGVMYVNSGKQWVYALNAQNGEKLWGFNALDEGEPTAASRGVTYWANGEDKRILYSAGNNLIAINAKTGKLIKSFGNNGKVNLNVGVRDNPEKISVTLTTPGSIFKDLIIVGSRLPDFYGAAPGYIRAYHVKTGKLVWTFHTIPHPGEKGYESWPKDAYKYAGGVNCWGGMTIDKKRGMVFLALGSPTFDYYGADRIGANLFGNCVLALDAATGQYKWHYQTVHHDLWDYDLPCPPNLVTIKKDGKNIDAVAQATKHGFIFILDRITGKPLYPVEERKVPASNIPGEVAYSTQPFPTKPKAFVKQFMTEEDLTNYSPESHDEILKKFRSVRYEGLFTPPDLKGTISLPATRGGINWGGAAYDPNTNMLYLRGHNLPEIQTIVDANKTFVARNNSTFERGRVTYLKHCATCHGTERNGIPPTFPSLIGLKERKKEKEILEKIRRGSGAMPGFKGVISASEENAILAYIFEKLNAGIETPQQTKTGTNPERYMNTTAYATWSDSKGNPALKGPWATLSALNLSTGDYEWQIPIGNDEKLQEKGGPLTGLLARSGPMVTAGGLVFISGAADKKLWAYDKKTGNLVWETILPGINNANVCSYMVKGKQYIALSVGGTIKNPGGSVMVFALP